MDVLNSYRILNGIIVYNLVNILQPVEEFRKLNAIYKTTGIHNTGVNT